ncbi:MAG TPA: hypothetical protein VK775_07315 [Chthoniobacterales bacterium]|jgi:hypothetical protein|nr:hypothetical protein [Chthoniobacterales bacterium]
MDDQAAVLQLFELSQALEEGPVGGNDTVVLEDGEEVDALATSTEYLGDFAKRVAEPDRAHPVDFSKAQMPQADEGGFSLPDVFGPPSEREQLIVELLKTPQMEKAKAAFVASVVGGTSETPRLNFKKLRSVDQLKAWVREMLSQGHTLESLVKKALEGGDARAAMFIRDAGAEVLAGQ